MEIRKWEDIGNDLLVDIFRRLEMVDLIFGVNFVCKSWYQASLNPHCWQDLDLHKLSTSVIALYEGNARQKHRWNHFTYSKFLRFAVARGQQSVTRLRFPWGSDVLCGDLEYISLKCPSMKVLDLSGTKYIPYNLSTVIRKWKDLEELKLTGSATSFHLDVLSQAALHCNKLSTLEIGNCLCTYLIETITKLRRLKCLRLCGCVLRKCELLAILKCCRELEELSLQHCCTLDFDGFNSDQKNLLNATHNNIMIKT